MDRRVFPGLVVGWAALVAGCGELPAPVAEGPADPPTEVASAFDPSATGTVAGQVTWSGVFPTVPDYSCPVSTPAISAGAPRQGWPNPNAPRIDKVSRGVGNAVVFLRGVEGRRARPWDLPAVTVEAHDDQFRVRQGAATRAVGFVRRGDVVEVVSRRQGFEGVRARGAACFAFTLPHAGRPSTRRLDKPGVVELTSAAGHCWMRAHLFVGDHPYYAATDAGGRFTLARVPAGDYELVCWLPDWREAERELNADTARVCRVAYRPPRELTRRVQVRAGAVTQARFRLSADAGAARAGP